MERDQSKHMNQVFKRKRGYHRVTESIIPDDFLKDNFSLEDCPFSNDLESDPSQQNVENQNSERNSRSDNMQIPQLDLSKWEEVDIALTPGHGHIRNVTPMFQKLQQMNFTATESRPLNRQKSKTPPLVRPPVKTHRRVTSSGNVEALLSPRISHLNALVTPRIAGTRISLPIQVETPRVNVRLDQVCKGSSTVTDMMWRKRLKKVHSRSTSPTNKATNPNSISRDSLEEQEERKAKQKTSPIFDFKVESRLRHQDAKNRPQTMRNSTKSKLSNTESSFQFDRSVAKMPGKPPSFNMARVSHKSNVRNTKVGPLSPKLTFSGLYSSRFANR